MRVFERVHLVAIHEVEVVAAVKEENEDIGKVLELDTHDFFIFLSAKSKSLLYDLEWTGGSLIDEIKLLAQVCFDDADASVVEVRRILDYEVLLGLVVGKQYALLLRIVLWFFGRVYFALKLLHQRRV